MRTNGPGHRGTGQADIRTRREAERGATTPARGTDRAAASVTVRELCSVSRDAAVPFLVSAPAGHVTCNSTCNPSCPWAEPPPQAGRWVCFPLASGKGGRLTRDTERFLATADVLIASRKLRLCHRPLGPSQQSPRSGPHVCGGAGPPALTREWTSALCKCQLISGTS